MNIPFTLKNSELDAVFLKQAQEHGLLQLKGHKLVGGMRASIYNAMPIEGVKTLISFMQAFEKANG
jgi:phosphoserine aminotransferase